MGVNKQMKSNRLFFIDAMRAWAILMMLQGHFIDGLLDNTFRDDSVVLYSVWKYFRGITAPVFFTVSGFIFTYLLIRVTQTGWQNPRVKKGLKRGLELLFIGYLLRTNLWGLLSFRFYDSFYLVDVLHCIGLSLLGIVGVYLATAKRSKGFPLVLAALGVLLFVFEPMYKTWGFEWLPVGLANYLTKANGAVFTIIPWFGYAAIGGTLAVMFKRFKAVPYFYPITITASLMVGSGLIFWSSDFFLWLSKQTGIVLFEAIQQNNYLFIRLGDVFLVFTIFMLFRKWMAQPLVLRIGQSTLSIYVIHFIILYGSFTGVGLYRYLHHSLAPQWVIPGALLFMGICVWLSLRYEAHKVWIKNEIKGFWVFIKTTAQKYLPLALYGIRVLSVRVRFFIHRLLRPVK
jgi:uncharacterized membrane protein